MVSGKDTLCDLSLLSYAETCQFFLGNPRGVTCEQQERYLTGMSATTTYDRRGQSFTEELDAILKDGTALIVIDGATCSGKKPCADKIAQKYGAVIVDIYLLKNCWCQNRKRQSAYPELIETTEEAEKDFQTHLNQILEEIVIKASKDGAKSVVLVGCFLDMMSRVVVADKIGRHFDNVISIMMQESIDFILQTLSQQKKKMDPRVKGMSPDKVRWEAAYVDELCEDPRNRTLLGIGADYSCIANERTVAAI